MSIRVMTAGEGYRYLLNSVVTGDGDRDAASVLTRYYVESGTPPGLWMGSGTVGLSDGVSVGGEVSEEQLRRLMGYGQDPNTGEQLGRPYRKFATASERVQRRIDRLPESLTRSERLERRTLIEADEAQKPTCAPVAGFDLTFSAPKSVSTLWAVADGGTQALIARAHHAAIHDVVGVLEREVAATRVGATGPRGAVAQAEIRGVIATAYDHYDSRASDPQLHTHVVVANRVQAVRDGKWRTLDSRALHGAITGLSEHYNAVLSEYLASLLGVGWEARESGTGRSTAWEIAGVPQDLMDEFSSRTRDIERVKDQLAAGASPSTAVSRQRNYCGSSGSRPLSRRGHRRRHTRCVRLPRIGESATRVLGQDAPTWASSLVARSAREPLLRADDIPLDDLRLVAGIVVERVGDRRATWKRWNLRAEAVRQTMRLRFASTLDRDTITGLIVDAAEHASLRLTPPELASSPPVFQRADGSSMFRPKASTVSSSEQVLAAEDRLLAASNMRYSRSEDMVS